jgi:uncharacterized protein YidB (DUF937 family)
MGLIDVVRSITNTTRGESPGATRRASPLSPPARRSIPPLAMALLGVVAYKALRTGDDRGFSHGEDAAEHLSEILSNLRPAGLLGKGHSAFSGPDLANLLSRGLRSLFNGFEGNGHEEAVQSWISNAPNQQVTPGELEAALGGDTLDALSRETGLQRQELLDGLASHLPNFVDRLTPEGHLPTEEEVVRYVMPAP